MVFTVMLTVQRLACFAACAPAALNLPQWLNLSTARSMLLERLMGHVAVSSLDAEEADKLRRQVGCATYSCPFGWQARLWSTAMNLWYADSAASVAKRPHKLHTVAGFIF